MLYKIPADGVVSIHFLWIIFLFFGALWGVENKVWLRSKHRSRLTYAGSFIIHYAERIVYIELSRTLILFLTVLLCGFNAWFYLRKK